jgi:hypothetical protein
MNIETFQRRNYGIVQALSQQFYERTEGSHVTTLIKMADFQIDIETWNL